MCDERFIEDLKIMIKMIIDLNDKLYKWALKKQYYNQRQKCGEDYVSHCAYEKKFETSRRVTAGLGFGQKKVSDPTLGSVSYNWTRPKIGH